jgi:hypothetical protein
MKRSEKHTIKHPFEIFEAVQACSKQADRVKLLQEHESYELKTILHIVKFIFQKSVSPKDSGII